MGNIVKSNNSGSSSNLVSKGIDILSDPKTSTAAKAGAVGIVAIGAITVVAKATIDAMSKR